MGKNLIIKGADFSQVAVNETVAVSESQSSLGTNHFYNASGIESQYEGVEGVQKITIPDGVTVIKPTVSTSGKEPRGINCFDNNGQIEVIGTGTVGGVVDLGTTGWYQLPTGTKSISYVYKSTINSFDLGLAMTWIGK